MIFYSLAFLAFFLVFSLLLQFSRTTGKQLTVFLLANVVFYAYWDYRFLLLLFGTITAVYICALLFSKTKNSCWIAAGIAAVLLTLGIFKYFNFFVETFAEMFGITDYVTLHLILPLGISFYTFQAISYLVDLKTGRICFDKNYAKLAVYISFFPQITSGPIVKARDFLPQLEKLHIVEKKNVYSGVQLFLTGLTKKIVFADRIGVAVNAVFAAPAAYNGISLLFAIIGYSLQIYFDFSGYSDMAVGIARIWGFELGKNFNAPYLAANPSEFWGRWHISLSSWFKEYVYIPLGGNRRGKFRTYCNLLITMLLSGLWHGADLTFLVWGAVHGLGSVAQKLFGGAKKTRKCGAAADSICTLLNCCFVALAWVIFRAASLEEAFGIIMGLFRTGGVFYINIFVVIYAVVLGVVFGYSKYKNDGNIVTINMDLDKFGGKVLIAVWIFAIVSFMYVGDSAFIYAQF